MDIRQILAALGQGFGGGSQQIPGIGGMVQVPTGPAGGIGAPAMPQGPMAPPAPQPPQTFGQKLLGGLGRLRDGMMPVDPRIAQTMAPEQLKALRNQAVLNMGLGMLAASSRGGRFGESVAAGLGQGMGGFQQGIAQQYQLGKEDRAEKRLVERQGVEDERYAEQQRYRQGRDAVEDQRYLQDAADLKAWREAQMASEAERNRIAELRATKEDKDNMTLRDVDRVRVEYQRQKGKLQEAVNSAQNLMMLTSDPEAAKDATKQIAMVFSFQRMLEPDSVTREQEYQIIQNARGLWDSIKNIPNQVHSGARLTPEQIQKMQQVATMLLGKQEQRISALENFYGELSTKRGVDPFDIIGRPWAPTEKPNAVDISKIANGGGNAGLGAPGNIPGLGGSIVPQKRVTVDY